MYQLYTPSIQSSRALLSCPWNRPVRLWVKEKRKFSTAKSTKKDISGKKAVIPANAGIQNKNGHYPF
jgi:hypothetical protein